VWSAGQSLKAGTPRQQAALAALVVDARRPVAIDTLVNRVWDDKLPANPVLYLHLSRIRRLLGPAVCVERRSADYVLDIDPDLVDLHRLRRMVDQGYDHRRDDVSGLPRSPRLLVCGGVRRRSRRSRAPLATRPFRWVLGWRPTHEPERPIAADRPFYPGCDDRCVLPRAVA